MPRSRGYNLHLPMISADDSRELRLLYFNRVIRDLVNKLSFFFFPIYLFQMGKHHVLIDFPLTDIQKGMIMIVLYYLLTRLLILIFQIPIAKFFAPLGYQRTMIVSYLVRAVYFCLLFFSSQNPAIIWLVIALEAFQTATYWPIYYTILSRHAHKEKMGADLGILQILLQIVAMLSPAFAGLVSARLGLSILFLFGLMGTMVGLIISLMENPKEDRDKVSLKEFLRWAREPSFDRLAISIAGRYIHDSVIFLWPLYVFFLLGSVEKVGYIYAAALFFAFLLSFFLASTIDKIRSFKSFRASGGLLAAVWLLRTQVLGAWSIALVDMTDKLLSNFHWLYYDMVLMRRGKGKEAYSYFVYREVIIGLCATVFWLYVGAVFLIGGGWQTVFVVASIGVLLSALMTDRNFDEPRA